jgi:hypothetical protein
MFWMTWSTKLLLFVLAHHYYAYGFVVSQCPKKLYIHSGVGILTGTTTFRYHIQQGRRQNQQLLFDTTNPQSSTDDAEIKKEKGVLDLVFNPYESKIPKEIEKDIYDAEGKTQAAKDRTHRITLYAIVAFSGVLCAFFNGFLTEIRTSPTPDGVVPPPDILDSIGFGWVYSNFLFTFLFTNKIGGIICLLGGGACGLLAEAEYDTRRINAEKIFDEMQRRRAAKDGVTTTKRKSINESKKSTKRRSGKESKRLTALSEVSFDSSSISEKQLPITTTAAKHEVTSTIATSNSEIEMDKSNDTVDENEMSIGVFGKIKEFYNQADSMAATQALLLNKKLEDEGLIPKITDATGFKIVGKVTATKLKTNESNNVDNITES